MNARKGLPGLLSLVVCLLLVAGLLQLLCTGCQSQRYDTTVNVYGGPSPGPELLACDAGALPAAEAEAPTARGVLRARAQQAVVVNVSDNLGGTTKPIEISPGRELSPAREGQIRDSANGNTIPLSGAGTAGSAAAAAGAARSP